MALFTVKLKDMMEYTDDIGLNDYPIYKEEHREVLNKKIVDRFLNQEIGLETEEMFVHHMRRWMNENMGYYNQQYAISDIEYNPLLTIDITSESESDNESVNTGESSNVSESDAKSRAVASDFPQSSLQTGSDYATSAQDNVSGTKANSDSTETQKGIQTGKVNSSTKGFQGMASEIVMAARQAVVNIDVMILDAIDSSGLFMQVWGSQDSYFEERFYNGYW